MTKLNLTGDQMGKVHPQALVSSDPCYLSSKQESFTVWMKSLVLSGKGCTVFDSDGHVVYRVDNYDSKSSNEVHLMDFEGKVLYTILRKVTYTATSFCESCTKFPF